MVRLWVFLLLLVFSCELSADSLRCRGKLVKTGESSNALIKKCGLPARKYGAREIVSENGRQREVGVSNWVYRRTGKNDIIASVRHGTVVKLKVDRS